MPTVRIATKDDAQQILEIAREWMPLNKEAEEQREKSLIKVLEKSNGHLIFIAEEDGEIIGWFDVKSCDDWFMLRKSVHIEHINVAKKHRGRGVGSKICQAIFNYFRDKEGEMYLIFFYSESGFTRFFVKNGFTITGEKFYETRIIKRERR